MSVKSDINKAGWEQSEFPILCETCLGDNAFVRMSKQEFGRSCGTCARPFTIFRWNPGSGMRYKTTVICQTCAKSKNVRDTALAIRTEAPSSDINREYFAQNAESKMEGDRDFVDASRSSSAAKEMLKQLARADPYYKRNRPHVCSFFVKGECKRGAECPYRHEKPRQNELAHQNIRDRYYGHKDPMARNLLSNFAAKQGLTPPEDASITTLFISSLPPLITESSLRTALLATIPSIPPASVKSVVYVAKSRCAFVNFIDRMTAEQAANAWILGFELEGSKAHVRWGRGKGASSVHAQR